MLGILSYSGRTGMLVVPERDEGVMRRIRSRWRTGPVLYLVAIFLSFVNPLMSFVAYVAILFFMVVQSMFWLRT
jgi:ABC-type microcin C transport system permease subunit YejE